MSWLLRRTSSYRDDVVIMKFGVVLSHQHTIEPHAPAQPHLSRPQPNNFFHILDHILLLLSLFLLFSFLQIFHHPKPVPKPPEPDHQNDSILKGPTVPPSLNKSLSKLHADTVILSLSSHVTERFGRKSPDTFVEKHRHRSIFSLGLLAAL